MSRVVLIAIDASTQAEAAFSWYIEHLHKPQNKIVVLHCIDVSSMAMCDPQSASVAFTQQKMKIKLLENKYRWKLNEKGLPGKILTEGGKPGEIIVETAKEENASLIVIGSRGVSKLKRTFQGSVSDYVMHKASCPVCVCRQKTQTENS